MHLNHVNQAGHESGHGTKHDYEALTDAGRLIGLWLAAVRKAGVEKSTYVLITADHGGVGKKHGGPELEIRWIITRPAVAKREIRALLNKYDTAAAVAAILNLKSPALDSAVDYVEC